MNRGWRRCGTYYYKMKMDKTCCPAFTIKCNVNDFKIKKQQRKTARSFIDLISFEKPSTMVSPNNKDKTQNV
jgi:arginine-tRNA-protein transferase